MYKVKKYEAYVIEKGGEYLTRFDMVKKLSENFNVFNKVASELDELLVKQIEIETQQENESETSSNATKPNKASKSSKNGTPSNIEDLFKDLYDELLNAGISNKSVNPNLNIEKQIDEYFKQNKISATQLEPNLLAKLNSQTQIIKYEIPQRETNSFQKPNIKEFQSIIDDVMMGNNVFFVGGAGTGKTYLAEQLIAKQALNREHITINCSQWTSPTEIIGGQTMDGYVEGKLIEAWQNGYILILDELPKIDPNTAGLFNDALAKTKIKDAIIFNARKESFKKHPDFGCIATGNIYPDKESMTYGANNKQDLSLLDRFSGSVYFIEKNPIIEKQILQNEMIWSICDKLRSAIEEFKYEAQLSLRFMMNARDTYSLEMNRIKKNTKNGVSVDDGKTFKTAIDSYLSTFTAVQQSNLKSKIEYSRIFQSSKYRNFDINESAY